MQKDTKYQIIKSELEESKATNIVEIDVSKKLSYTDIVFIATASSSRQAISLARNIESRLREQNIKDTLISGGNTGDWVLLDAGEIIIHIFRAEVREFYDLEKIWA